MSINPFTHTYLYYNIYIYIYLFIFTYIYTQHIINTHIYIYIQYIYRYRFLYIQQSWSHYFSMWPQVLALLNSSTRPRRLRSLTMVGLHTRVAEESIGKPWENHRKTIGKLRFNHRQMVRKFMGSIYRWFMIANLVDFYLGVLHGLLVTGGFTLA